MALFTNNSYAKYEKLFFDLNIKDIDGKIVNFSEYKNKTILIVNVASKCGFTSQYNDWLFFLSIIEEEKIRGFFLQDIIQFYGRGATGLNAFVLSEQYDKRKLRISYEVCKSTIYYIMQKKQISRPLLTYVTKHCLSLLKSLFLYGINTIPTKKH